MNVEWHHERVSRGVPVVPDIAPSEWCLRPDDVRTRLAGALDASHLDGEGVARRITQIRILGVHVQPGRSLEVGYELAFDNTDRAIVTARFVRQGASGRAFAKAVAEARNSSAVLHLPEHDAVLWRFPEDAGLPHLTHMRDTSGLAAARGTGADRPALPDRAATPGRWWQTSALSYRRADRCAMLYRAPDDGEAIVGKMQAGAARSHERMSRLHAVPTRRFGMPRPLGCDPSHDLRWESFIAGSRFEDQATSRGSERAAHDVAAALVDLHRTALRDLPIQDAPAVLSRLQHVVLKRIDQAELPAGAMCRELADTLAARCPEPQRRPATLHGDLHTGNVLFEENRVGFIDLDSLAQGDAALDLALFGSRLVLLAATDTTRHGDLPRLVSALPRVYESYGGDAIDDWAFGWYMAAFLIGRQIKTCINHAAPALEPTTTALAAVAHDIVRRGRCDPNGIIASLTSA